MNIVYLSPRFRVTQRRVLGAESHVVQGDEASVALELRLWRLSRLRGQEVAGRGRVGVRVGVAAAEGFGGGGCLSSGMREINHHDNRKKYT